MFPETHENSDSLTDWMKVAKSLKNEGKVEGKKTESDHDHYRLVNGALADRHLGQICCIDNERTGTQASVWCDSMRKQVLVRKLLFVRRVSVLLRRNITISSVAAIGTDDDT